MRKLYTLVFFSFSFLFFGQYTLHAQCNPGACGSPVPSVDAQQACVLPNPGALDCYFGATTFDAPISLPPSWCTTVENNHFFAFTADAASASFNICTFGCAEGTGIQAAVLSTADCINFQFASGCLGDIGSGTCQGLTANGLNVGEVYYLMIDGSAGSVCDYSINGVNPTINGPSGPICLPSQTPYTYTTNTISNWSINPASAGNILGNPTANQIQVSWQEVGHAEVCAQSVLCPNAPNLCIPVDIGEHVTMDESYDVCQGQTVECAGQTFSSNGTFPVRLTSYLGCDSTIRCRIHVIPTATSTQNVRMCFDGSVSCAGVDFDAAGTHLVTLQTPQGCDSIVRCVVSIIPPISTPTQFVTFCAPAEYTVCGETYTQTAVIAGACTSFLGCDSTVNVDLAILEPEARIAAPPTLNCGSNLTVTLDGSSSSVLTATGGVTLYTWTGPGIVGFANQSTVRVNQPGEYCLIVKHGRGAVACSDTACVTVLASATPPGATATGGSITCLVGQTTLMGSATVASPVNYTWTGPGINPGNQFQQNPTVNQPGTYTLTVLNPANGCSSTAQYTVNSDTIRPAASAVGGSITCLQNNVTIDGVTNIASPNWNWAGPGINAGNQTVENPNVLSTGTYTVTVTNPLNGCSSTATTTVSLNNTAPTAAAGANDTLTCISPTLVLQGAGTGGGQPLTFSWTGPNGYMSDSLMPVINTAGTYILTVLNTQNGCLKKDTVVISSNQVLPLASAGADSTINCLEPTVSLIGGASSTGANFTALWTGPGITPANANQYNPVVAMPGNYTLVITNSSNGCTASDMVVVNQNTALPTALAGTDMQLTCSNPNGVTLDGSGSNPPNVTFLWSGPGIGSNNDTIPNPVVTQAGTYDLVITNPVNGCTSTDQVIVTQDANVPAANGGPDQTLNCTVTSVDLDGTASAGGAGIIYTWSGPGISGGNASAQSPTGLTMPGTYFLTVTNTNNNCENTDAVVILIDTIAPQADAGNALILNCFNNATDTLDASGSSLGSTFTLLWSGMGITPANENSVNPVISNQSGTYTLVVTNTDNTCTAIDQVNVSLDLAPPVADAGQDRTIDCVATTAVIGGNSSAGANFSYLWTGPGIDASNETLASPTIDAAGTYTLVVTDSVNGCTASNDVVVNTTALLPTSLAGNDGLLTCANPQAVLDGSGSDAGANFQTLWTGPGINAANQNLLSPSVTVPGTYILEITNTQNSCIKRDTVIVDENKAIPAADAGASLILDCMTTDVTLDGSLSGVSPTIVYVWSGPGINAGNQAAQSPNINQPGTYDLIVMDNENGCSATDQVLVTQDTVAPVASAGADALITCAQLTQMIDGSGSSVGAVFVYVWDGPGINSNNFSVQSPVVNMPGAYFLTVTNTQNHCTAVDAINVNEDKNAPAIAAGPDRTLNCSLATVQLDATQSASGANIGFLWSGPGIVPGDQTSATPTVNLAGLYTLTLTDATNGCTSTESVSVNIDTLKPVVFAGGNMILTCANASTGVTLSSQGSDSGPNFAYLWSGPGITTANESVANPLILQPGIYTLMITNLTNGCTKTDEVEVQNDQNLPTADAGLPQVITCATTMVTLDATGSSSPNGSLTYFWSGPGINTGNQDIATPTVSVSGIYLLNVTNLSTGCSASAQVEVTLDTEAPVATAASELITCIDLVSSLTSTSSLPGSTFLWTGPDVAGSETNQNIEVDLAGIYTVTATAPNGCTGSASTTVMEDSNVPQGSTYGTVLNCLNNGTSQIGGEVFGPAGSTFAWTGPGIGTVTTSTVAVSQPGTYTFTISAPNGCVRPFTAEVIADFAEPTVVAASTEVLDCNTTEVTLNGSASSSGPDYTFTWSTTNGHFVSGINTLTPKVDQPGQYQLNIVNEENGCSATAQAIVTVDPRVPSGFDLTVNNIRCFGDVNGSIVINGVMGGTAPFNYTLTNSGGSNNNQYTGLGAGTYTLALEDANGCLLDTTFTISEPGELLVELGPDVTVSLGENATVTAQIASTAGIRSVKWNYTEGCIDTFPYCQTFTYLPLHSYLHEITVTDSNGCIARDDIRVIVRKPRDVYVPNIFNPNSSENSIVTVFGGIDVSKINSFQIYDRWGDQVFQAIDFLPNDLSKGWDGVIRGQPGQLGVYVWYCEVEFIDGETLLLKGDVTLVR